MNSEGTGDERHWVVLFDSIHFVLAAERVFRERGVWCDLVPVPRDLSSDCGMVIEFRRQDLAAVRTILEDPRLGQQRVYQPVGDGHQEVGLSG
ncbi:MAG: hypothetical protein A2V70_02360 [Planctomycetes bacterium RBG_13_63_9]|nr:MAG: hypothetical protein A2V70_02360 [Planctomycetes bacterium RBG_13_63_9]